jgi:hypothetical protein
MMNANIHSEKNFKPEDYEILDYLDNKRPEYVFGMPMDAYKSIVDDWKREIAHYFPTSRIVDANVENRQIPEHNIHKCRHCGCTNVRYIVAVRHIPSDTNLVFGDICVAHLGFANYDAFKAAKLRAKAAQGNASLKIFKKRLQFLNANPEFRQVLESEELNHPDHANNGFLQDIVLKLNKYGFLSEAQVNAFLKSVVRDHEFAVKRAERERAEAVRRQTAMPAPTGRNKFTGQIISIKTVESAFGVAWKTLVLLDCGSKVWMTLPSGLSSEDKNKKIEFKATLTQSKDDALFFFGKRPSLIKVLQA